MNEQDMRRLNEVFALAGSVLTVVVLLRIVLGPDALNRAKMRGCLVVSRTAKAQADALLSVAAHADTAYQQMRNVTV